jgi:thymidine phosphorylase
VKTGSGAFMKDQKDAEYLAGLMVDTGKRMGKRMVALITDMEQPLGNLVGNAFEVVECIDILNGKGPADLRELCLELAAWMFFFGDKTRSVADGRKLSEELIANGKAMQKFREMIRVQGGDERVVDDVKRLPQPKNKVDVSAKAAGYVTSIMCEKIGTACVVIGGGREKKEDSVDPAVGLVVHKKLGDAVSSGEPLVTIHYNSDSRLAEALKLIESAYTIAAHAPSGPRPMVRKIIGEQP